MIVSASRRTDIPARFPAWMLQRVLAGHAEAVNPFNPRLRRRVSLAPQDVKAHGMQEKKLKRYDVEVHV